MANFTLKSVSGKEFKVSVRQSTPSNLEIQIEGYGDYYSENGSGTPLLLDCFDGSPVVFVFAGINQEEPTHRIDLEGALEVARE